MRRAPDLPAAYIRSVLNYDPETGVFRWKATKARRVQNGSVAGSAGRKYWLINLKAVPRPAHRLAWIFVHGDGAPEYLDHKDGDGFNNRITNLRPCTSTENHANQKRTSRNKSGFKGVSWHAGARQWRATIVKDHKQVHLGFYADAEVAHQAYMKAAENMFGEFARAA